MASERSFPRLSDALRHVRRVSSGDQPLGVWTAPSGSVVVGPVTADEPGALTAVAWLGDAFVRADAEKAARFRRAAAYQVGFLANPADSDPEFGTIDDALRHARETEREHAPAAIWRSQREGSEPVGVVLGGVVFRHRSGPRIPDTKALGFAAFWAVLGIWLGVLPLPGGTAALVEAVFLVVAAFQAARAFQPPARGGARRK